MNSGGAPLLVAALAVAALPSEPVAQPRQPAAPGSASSDIIVVAPVNPDDFPVQTRNFTDVGIVSRSLGSEAEQFARCTRNSNPPELRDILAYGPGDGRAQHGLHRYIVRNRACYRGYPVPTPASPYLGECNPQILELPRTICRAILDRGALFERAVKSFAPPIALTREVTLHRPTYERFLRRAAHRNARSETLDDRYFRVVGCMVQISPTWAARLLEAKPGTAEEMRARRIVIGYGSPCVGNAAKVSADPAQFRAYTAEAIYAWLAAAADLPLPAAR